MDNQTLRLDKWLWHARFFKSRSLATKLCASGKLRVNSTTIAKPHHTLKAGDVLTFPKGPYTRVIKVLELGTRRGPAAQAQTLYEDMDPPQPCAKKNTPPVPKPAVREAGAGRPTKAQRRATDRLKGR